MPAAKAKNRRYHGAKISEYMLRRVVEGFAHNRTAKDTAARTKLSPQAVNHIYTRLREQLRDYGMINSANFKRDPNQPSPARVIFETKHRGVPDKDHGLHEFEVLNRILSHQRFQGFEKLSAADPKHVDRARRLQAQGGRNPRYNVIEVTKERPGSPSEQRPFVGSPYRTDSTILINERHTEPHAAFFRYLWALLLKHPL